MKRRRWISALMALGVAVFSSCGVVDFVQQIIESVQYPEVYYIEYQITQEDNTIVTMAKSVDEEGDCYYKNGVEEYVFDFNGTVYTVYKKEPSGWTNTQTTVNEKYIEEFTESFQTYAEKGREKFNGQYKKGNNDTFLGRTCETYTLELKIVNFTQSYQMLLDENTGICLRYKGVSSVNDKQTGESGFVCVAFETENVDVSSYLQSEGV